MLGSQSAPGSAGFEATAHSLLVVDLLLLLCDSDLVRLFGRIARGLAHQSPAPAAMGGSAVCASEDHKSGDYRRTLFAGVECGLTSPSSASHSSSSPLVHIQAPCISVEPPLGNESPPRYASARATERGRDPLPRCGTQLRLLPAPAVPETTGQQAQWHALRARTWSVLAPRTRRRGR